MHGKGQDGLTYVRYYGRPDLFITFTCNSNWPEIKSNLLDDKQKPNHRHDITARVFKLKLKKMMDLIVRGQLYGPVKCFLYTIEWQKRGLPHAHILIWLENKIRSTDIDTIISAEFPNKDEDPELYETIKRSMIHGPCGNLNPRSPCMVNGTCSNKYPRTCIPETKTDGDGYPLYRRRSKEEGGHTASIPMTRGQTRELIEVDNGWVVPHSKLLCKIFDAHINVEYCNSVKAIKYVCKYCTKGPDRAVYHVVPVDGEGRINDEITRYEIGRYISSSEAFWRIFGFDIHEHYPPVTPLAVHLENGQRVIFNQANIREVAETPRETTLTGFFQLNQTDEFASTLLYPEVPRYFRWDKKDKRWQRRKQGKPHPTQQGIREEHILSRVASIHPSNSECYHLRLLLHNLRGPTSFEEMKIVDGEICQTFKEACRRRGLIDGDDHFNMALQEASVHASPTRLRRLFATMMINCNLSDPMALWNQHKESMSEDILHRSRQASGDNQMPFNENIFNLALVNLEDATLEIGGKTLSAFGLPLPRRQDDGIFNRFLLRETNYDRAALQEFVNVNVPRLTPDQEAAYHDIIGRIYSGRPGIMFLDAPGGTGKSFLININLANLRGRGDIAIAVATSGIAATLLQGGKTAHSTFRLPLNLKATEHPTCNIAAQSEQATVLRKCKLIVWDEATMVHKNALRALDSTLQDLRGNPSPMGGVLLLLAGDFRQTLPIIAKGTQADEIEACLKSSYLWRIVEFRRLTTNMRARLQNDPTAETFSTALLRIGDGMAAMDSNGSIDLSEIGNCVDNAELLCSKVYPNLETNYSNTEWLCQRALLAPTNEDVNHLNELLLSKIDGGERVYSSVDTVTDPDAATTIPVEFLNTQDVSGLPPHKLHLKVGCPIILLRNLDAPKLCNGTRLAVKGLHNNVIEATILTGQSKGETAFIPKMPMALTDSPYPWCRLQFPVRSSFAMTINKSQGQSLQVVGIYLKNSCFSHGQLYVACSRVGSSKNLYVFAPNGRTKNVVYKAALQ